MALSMKVTTRTTSGKGAARATRREDLIPGVIYGAGKTPMLISLKTYDLMMTLRKGGFYNSIIELDVDGKATEKVLARDIQRDPISSRALHIDFLRFDPKRAISVEVEIRLIGEEKSPAVKAGGVIQLVTPEIEVLCRADNIPQFIEVAADNLDFGDNIHVSEIKLPDGVKLPKGAADVTVVSVLSSQTAAMSDTEMGVAPGTETEVITAKAPADAKGAAAPAAGAKGAAAAPAKGAAAPAAKAPAAKAPAKK